MRHHLLGPSGLRVSELCLGTLGFGEPKSWGTAPEEAAKILRAFANAGGSLVDTAPNYAGGASEEIVGEFVRGVRDEFVLATKYTASANAHPLAGGNSRRTLVRSVEESLKRLRTDRIDLMWLHYWDATTPLDEIMRALDDLVSAGKLLYIGLSDTPAWLVSRAATLAELRGWARVIAVQVEYNVASRDAERELLPMADALDLGILCWGPLAAGALSGGSDPQRRKGSAIPPRLAGLAAELRKVADIHGATPRALALAWLLRGGGAPRIPIVGARTAGQLQELVDDAKREIPAEALAAVQALAPLEPGFPQALIASPYLRKLAYGDPDALTMPRRARA